MMDEIKQNLGVIFSVKINVRSDKKDADAAVDYQFGSNKLPTKKETDKVIRDGIKAVNEALGVDDARLSTMEDFGFAASPNLEWKLD